MLDDCYDYINALGLLCVYQYENKKSVSIDNLVKFRNEATNMTGDDITINKPKELEMVNSFVKKYFKYFAIDGNNIKLQDNISYDELLDLVMMIKDRDDIDDDVSLIAEDFNLLSILGVSSMRDILFDYLKIESKLEDKYQELYTSDVHDDIAKLLRARTGLLLQVHMLPSYSALGFYKTISDMIDCIPYDNDPVNFDIYMQSDFYTNDESYDDLESQIYDIYQYSIFGNKNNKLSSFKLLEEINNIYLFNSEKDDVLIEEDPVIDENRSSKEERLFYLTYLSKVHSYLNKYGSDLDLQLAYTRLLYSLDNISDKLYLEGNIEKAISKLDNVEIDEDSFVGLHDEMLFIASEVFETGINKFTFRKLLLLSTFYDLTKCEDVVYIIDNYKDNKNYLYFCDIIFGDSKNKGYGKKYEL